MQKNPVSLQNQFFPESGSGSVFTLREFAHSISRIKLPLEGTKYLYFCDNGPLRQILDKPLIFFYNIFLGVAYILTNEAKVYDGATLAAAILHDTVEDTKTTFEEIQQEFGQEVWKIV